MAGSPWVSRALGYFKIGIQEKEENQAVKLRRHIQGNRKTEREAWSSQTMTETWLVKFTIWRSMVTLTRAVWWSGIILESLLRDI